MRISLTVSYDGTRYCGWQVQPNGITVQEQIEKAIFSATGEKVRVTGSGRTDAGVHAKGQVAHFDTESSIPAEKFYKALNVFLPEDIRVLESCGRDQSFHACNGAKRKTYQYSFYVSEVENPLKDRYFVKLEKMPNLILMKEISTCFIGEHDFKAFCASGSSAKTTVRTIYDIGIKTCENDLVFTVTGNGFLYNMVRILVGTIIEAGYGKIKKEQVQKMLQTGERSLGGKTLPAKGLCLQSVEY